MTVTALFYLPVPPSAVGSPSAGLINQLSNKFPSQAHKPYHLDHRLFVDTSSLLPPVTSGAQDATSTAAPNSGTRQYTHLLTTSHLPQSTFVGTTAKNNVNNMVMITIPTEGQDGFMQLLVMKMQALWAHRQSVALEGVSVDLPLRKEEQWTVRVGDLKSTGTGLIRATGGPGAGGARAVLVEIQYSQHVAAEEQTIDEPTIEVYEDILRGLLKKLFRDINEFNFEDAKGVVKETEENDSPDGSDKPRGWKLASLHAADQTEANRKAELGPEVNSEALIDRLSKPGPSYKLMKPKVDKKRRQIKKASREEKRQKITATPPKDAVKLEFEEATQREIKTEREDMRAFGLVKIEKDYKGITK